MDNEIFKYKNTDLIEPCLNALKRLDGSGTTEEIKNEVIKILNLSDDEINEIHRNSTTKLEYRLGWAKTCLKTNGYIENTSRGNWTLTDLGKKISHIDTKKNTAKARQNLNKKNKDVYAIQSSKNIKKDIYENEYTQVYDDSNGWQDKILDIIKSIKPYQFERLCKLLLRELGCSEVVVTKQTRDGGIDGYGILKTNELIKERIVFQAKKYKNKVCSPDILAFRGAITSGAERGIFITTGIYTTDAEKEAKNPKHKPIVLIDGNALANYIKTLKLGVKTETVEKITIDTNWFKNI